MVITPIEHSESSVGKGMNTGWAKELELRQKP